MKLIQHRQRTRGFTLVELMIVIAIIGILAAVGYPAYSQHVKKGKRADAIDGLLQLQGRMEEYYMNNDSYKDATAAGVYSGTSKEGYYTLKVTSADAYQYKLQATPTFTDTECTTLTLDSQGQKGSTGTGSNCW